MTKTQTVDREEEFPAKKQHSTLAKRIAKHVAVAKKLPTSPLMMIGKLVSYILVGAMLLLTIAILVKPEYLSRLLGWVLQHISTLG